MYMYISLSVSKFYSKLIFPNSGKEGKEILNSF